MTGAVALLAGGVGCAPLPRLEEARELFANRLPCKAEAADATVLRRAYLQLALQFHPDKRPEDERVGASQLFQAIAAVYEGHLKVLDPDSKKERAARVKSPVAAAAELGELEELRSLLTERPYLANEADDIGVYPLMFAAAGGCVEAAKVLLEFGADLHAMNPIKWSVLLYASLGNHGPMVRFLVDRGAKVTDHELILAAYTGNPEGLEAMLELFEGSVPAVRTDESKKSLLHLACEGMCFLRHTAERQAKCVELLLRWGVPIDARDPRTGRTCLQDYVADVRWRTRGFENSASHMRVLEQLCVHGASVSVEDAEGHSALSLAAENELKPAREVLLSYA
eukprot:TRINITY_DN17318_c0_g2_i2.p1 TRINITY_DN17318_c0_g2~~TRINITY_DN17318_c0_g2_i2.p1  ORF type:complete len:339 (-),score=54.31 TRINITY_DN17318_c0_g2_i2:60-1076(-)